jgi:TatD DNase family protein
MIDTHTHLNFAAFKDDWGEVVKRANASGVEKMVVVGTDIESSKKAVEMAHEVECLYATCGIHPHHAKQYLSPSSQASIETQLSELRGLLTQPKVVAVGEIGLDFHEYRNSKKYKDVSISDELVRLQKELFVSQVKLAIEYNKPVIVHSRDTKDEVLGTLKQVELEVGKKVKAVFHCFEGSKKYARKILEAGYYISFTGNITYESGRAETSKEIPLNRLLLETDCPYMTPLPIRNKKDGQGHIWRNEPSNVKITAKHHAKLREISFEEIVKQTTLNAKELFGI